MRIRCLFIFTAFLLLLGCKKETDDLNVLTVSKEKIEFPEEGGASGFTIKTDADSWKIQKPSKDWLSIPVYSGTEKEVDITLKVETRTLQPRSDTLTITAGNAKPAYVIVLQGSSEYLYEITTNRTSFIFGNSSGSASLIINTNAPTWKLSADSDWVQLSQQTGVAGETTVEVGVLINTVTEERKTNMILSAEVSPALEISIIQNRALYPGYNTNPIEPDKTGMGSTAMELANKMNIGWNIGNTLEAIGGETAWGNPLVTEELIQLVKQNGFNAIRIPCSWEQYMANSTTAKLKTEWLDRVKQVVQYCVDNDMYVLLNIHWDGGWLENNCTTDKQQEVKAKQRAFWEQIATHLRDFDERLMFASANEPHVENAQQMAVLDSYHQTFVDAVRSTGGRNSYRVLVIQGPSTDVERTYNLMSALPVDEVENRMMVEIHYYTPFQFCLMTEDASWGRMFHYWGEGYHSETDPYRNADWGEESTLDNLMGMMKSQFVNKGIPVILGEYCVVRRTGLTGDALDLHLRSRAYFLEYLTRQARANGLIPFYWDAGNMGNNASALFNRYNYTIYDQQALDALMRGANE